jgi:hypothetical protein
MGPTQSPVQWVKQGVKQPGCGTDPTPPSNTEVKERVELYPYNPHGASWPVLGWTLPSPLLWNKYTLLTHAMGTSSNKFCEKDCEHTELLKIYKIHNIGTLVLSLTWHLMYIINSNPVYQSCKLHRTDFQPHLRQHITRTVMCIPELSVQAKIPSISTKIQQNPIYK